MRTCFVSGGDVLTGTTENGVSLPLSVNVLAQLQAGLQQALSVVGGQLVELPVSRVGRCPLCDGPADGYRMHIEVDRQVVGGPGTVSWIVRCARCGTVE